MAPNLSTASPELDGKIITPRDLFLRAASTTEPAAVLLPGTTGEVVAALRFARERGLPVTVRSGGHGGGHGGGRGGGRGGRGGGRGGRGGGRGNDHGLSERGSGGDGVVIDLSAMNRVEVLDRDTRLVRVEAGARWSAVAQALAPYGLAIGSGYDGDASAGAVATAGGIGWLVRQYGLTIDHVRAAEVVLGDGSTVRADAEHEPDLLWAVRGAGSGVGIVVAFEIEAMELRDVGHARIAVEIRRNGHALRQWADHVASAAYGLTSAVTLQSRGDALVALITAVVSDAEGYLRTAVEPLLRVGTRLLDLQVELVPYPALVSTAHPRPCPIVNGLLAGMTDADAAAITDAASLPQQPLIELRSVGGAVNDVPAGATAYAHRHQNTLVVASNVAPRADRQGGAELDAACQALAERLDGARAGFGSRPGPSTFARSYPGATGDRVLRLWRRYDPDGIFRAF